MAYVEPDPKWLENKECELFDTVCSPNEPDNFVEALDNAHDSVKAQMKELLNAGDEKALGHFLLCYVEDYWCERSREMAEDCWTLGDEAVLGRW